MSEVTVIGPTELWAEMRRVMQANAGVVTPALLVEAAANPDNIFHSHFEWDDRVAGHKYRLVQAERLIRRFRIEVVTPDGHSKPIRAITSVPFENGEREYRETLEVAADPDLSQRVIAGLQRDLVALRERLARFEVFHDVVTAIDDLDRDKD